MSGTVAVYELIGQENVIVGPSVDRDDEDEIDEPDTPLADQPFADVASDAWYAEAVAYVKENGMMTGTSDTTFAPQQSLSRAMMAQVLYNLEGKPALEGESLGDPFADVPGDSWYADAVYWARLEGLADGYSAETFGPEDSITREQLAVMLYRYAQYKGYDVSASGGLTAFGDGAKTSDWAAQAMEWAVGSGLINGKNGAALDPQGTATRAEVAQILMKFGQNVQQ